MMGWELYFGFVAASVLLALMPGPNVAVIVANSITFGARHGLMTVAGTTAAMVPQLLLTTLGMTAAIGFAAEWFEVLRWLGVAYLIYLGVIAFRAPPLALTGPTAKVGSVAAAFWRGVIVSLTNPKTLLFFGAFLPQFIDSAKPALGQLALLSLTFVVIGATLDSVWALSAASGRGVIAKAGRWANRVTGGLFIGAGLALALTRR
jgi:homoserine/homoserine lactone efflux protein